MSEAGLVIKSGNVVIGSYKPVFVIAEIGGNHGGKVPLALRMIYAAASAGANAVKFQSYRTDELAAQRYPGYRELKKEELSFADFKRLSDYCRRRRIVFLSTPFDSESADFLARLRVSFFKIASGDIDNVPLIRYIANKKKPVLLSTGASSLPEVTRAVSLIKKYGGKQVIVLHCVSAYPAAYREMNLNVLPFLAKKLRCIVGLSDHTEGIEASLAAVALGAKVIEKHFTIDRRLAGGDNRISLRPEEFRHMVDSIRKIECALGRPQKAVTSSERKLLVLTRRSIVARLKIAEGQIIAETDLALKRPARGISPGYWDRCIGKRSRRAICKDEYLSLRDLR